MDSSEHVTLPDPLNGEPFIKVGFCRDIRVRCDADIRKIRSICAISIFDMIGSGERFCSIDSIPA